MATSAIEKIEMDVPIKATPQQFYEVLCNKTHHISNVCPDIVKGIELHEGDWGTEGCIISWNYVFAGKTCISKQRIEDIDKENNKITFKVLGGDLLEDYKSFKFIMQIVPQREGSVVRWIVEYEKLNNNVPNPHSLFHLSVEVLKYVDAHLAPEDKK
ncbi:putative START-like domain-containing protein [Medicago truncatula]|uniref:Polyketide cyclase/dehydrase and lipid transporter n=1 Tax=Medicago truncatula TaxID=3880 RepID=G7LFU4_MEDTR|nr:MLP-like protein 43 [Medicago truncatula]AET01440.1 polyketide cyclase/dehydrase and lipid transporter [Medicago truncatula]RHN39009.1 putative START-like domain-containing protein [Medicago truncatula]